MESIKKKIESTLAEMVKENEKLGAALTDKVKLTDYTPNGDIWTEALEMALFEHEIVLIPEKDTPYLIDRTVVIPPNRRIIADKNAVIRLADGTKTIMFRNKHTLNGTHAPIQALAKDTNITIEGGIWVDCQSVRLGYGQSGMYDEKRSFFGVSTLFFFDNINHLTLKNITFKNCSGFAVQCGDITNLHIENIFFDTCFADGLHINGNVEKVFVKNIRGEVGDDLVAFNMFDWQNSSVNFGPAKTVICEDVSLTRGGFGARIQPGVYTYADGSEIDCSIEDAIFRRIENISTFKLYCQTPAYHVGETPEKVSVGSGNNIIFEDIKVDLNSPIDLFKEYTESDPVAGSIAAFELGLNAKNMYFKNIDLILHRDKYPYSYLVCIGPKSARRGDLQIFDPYFSSHTEKIYFENITVNGEKVSDVTPYVREIVFDRLFDDMPSTAKGSIGQIICK